MRRASKLWALLLLAAPPGAFATTVVYRDVPALAKEADQVVVGKVLSSQARWSGDGRRIFTEVVVEVQETLKGAAREQVVIRQPGGEVGEIGQRVDGVARFLPGEEVVVFLERRGDGAFLVAGMAQGKYRVERSSDGKAAFAVPEPWGEALVMDPLTRQPTTVVPQAMDLQDLRAKVARALSQGEQVPPGQRPPGPVQRVP